MRHFPRTVTPDFRSRTTCALAALVLAMLSPPLLGQSAGPAQILNPAPAATSTPTAPDPGPREQRIASGLRALADVSGKLSDWTLPIFGGTFLVILGTSYRRPESKRMLASYALIPIAWFLLGFSFYEGFVLQRYHVALLLREQKAAVVNEALHGMNDAFAMQLDTFLWSLVPLAGWLLIYTGWWIFAGPKAAAPKEERE